MTGSMTLLTSRALIGGRLPAATRGVATMGGYPQGSHRGESCPQMTNGGHWNGVRGVRLRVLGTDLEGTRDPHRRHL
jgi:hypothetical protein